MNVPRDKGAAVSQVSFGIAYGSLNEKLWSHLDTLLSVVQVLFGSFAVAGLLGDPMLAKAAGGLLAGVTALQLGLSPRKRSIEFRDARIRFHDLMGRAWGMELADLERELEHTKAHSPSGVRAFNKSAWNIAAGQLGHEARYPLTRFERLLLALAW